MLGTLPSRCLRIPFRTVSRETIRKGVRGDSGAFILLVPGSEIGLRGPVSSTFGASVRSLAGLFGRFLETVRKGVLRQWLGRVPSMRRAYQTDLSDAEWFHIEPLVPAPKALGRPRVHTLREILNAIFYIVRSGCAWRLLPHDFPPWKTIHHYFRA